MRCPGHVTLSDRVSRCSTPPSPGLKSATDTLSLTAGKITLSETDTLSLTTGKITLSETDTLSLTAGKITLSETDTLSLTT